MQYALRSEKSLSESPGLQICKFKTHAEVKYRWSSTKVQTFDVRLIATSNDKTRSNPQHRSHLSSFIFTKPDSDRLSRQHRNHGFRRFIYSSHKNKAGNQSYVKMLSVFSNCRILYAMDIINAEAQVTRNSVPHRIQSYYFMLDVMRLYKQSWTIRDSDTPVVFLFFQKCKIFSVECFYPVLLLWLYCTSSVMALLHQWQTQI